MVVELGGIIARGCWGVLACLVFVNSFARGDQLVRLVRSPPSVRFCPRRTALACGPGLLLVTCVCALALCVRACLCVCFR